MAIPCLEGRDLHVRVDGQQLDSGHGDTDLRVDHEPLVEHAVEHVGGAESRRGPLNSHNGDTESNGYATGRGARRVRAPRDKETSVRPRPPRRTARRPRAPT